MLEVDDRGRNEEPEGVERRHRVAGGGSEAVHPGGSEDEGQAKEPEDRTEHGDALH